MDSEPLIVKNARVEIVRLLSQLQPTPSVASIAASADLLVAQFNVNGAPNSGNPSQSGAGHPLAA
jgi:hypothetical protein